MVELYYEMEKTKNVAFIVSGKGFDLNAQKAALGCLRESGELNNI